MFRKTIVIVIAAVALAMSAYAAGVDKDNLKEYGRGIIKDYSDMNEDEGIEWVWLRSGVRLSEHRFKLNKSFENLTTVTDDDMEEVLNKTLPRTLDRAGSKDSGASVLRVEGAIFWAERANRSKRWIPYAGGHLAQAGLGIELVIRDGKGDIVCKIRHSGREGDDLDDAAEELLEDISKYVKGN